MMASLTRFTFLFAITVSIFAQATPARADALQQMSAREFREYIAQPNSGLVLLMATATWCPVCRHYLPEFRQAAEDLKSAGITLVQMDYDQNPNFLGSLGVRSLPTIEVFYNGVRHWVYESATGATRLDFEAKQALEASEDGSFAISRHTLFQSVQ